MKTKKALINTSVIILYQIINMVIGLVLPKFFTETFGSSYNGLNQTIKQITTWLTLLQSGIMVASIQALFKPISEKNNNVIYSTLQHIKKQYNHMGIIFIILLLVITIIWAIIGNSEFTPGIIVYFMITHGISCVINSFFIAKYIAYIAASNKNYIVYLINIFVLLLSSVMKLLVLWFFKNIYVYQTIALVDSLFRYILLHISCQKDFNFLKDNATITEDIQIAKRKDVLPTEIAGFIVNSTDVLLISYFLGFAQASIYAIYSFVVSGVVNILASIREGVYSGLGHLVFSDREKFKKLFASFETIFFAIMFLLFSITIVAYRPFIEIYTSKMDQNYVFKYLPILFVGVQLFIYLRIPSLMATNSAGHFKQTKIYAIIEAIINIVLTIILIQIIGIEGALIATIIGGTYRTVMLVNYCNKNILQRSNFVYLKKVVLCGLPFLIAVILSFYPWKIPTFFSWIVFAIIISIIFAAIYIIMLIFMEKDYLVTMIKNLFRKVKR